MSEKPMKYQCLDCKQVMNEDELLIHRVPEREIGGKIFPAREVFKCRKCRGKVVPVE
jgi:DNA-directed RNA polymerase subunit RPC12/RpoP